MGNGKCSTSHFDLIGLCLGTYPSTMRTSDNRLDLLKQQLELAERGREHAAGDVSHAQARVSTGCGMGELSTGVVHELLGVGEAGERARPWLPPVAIMVHLASCQLILSQAGSRVVWIGRECWPCPLMLRRHAHLQQLLEASVYVDARSVDDRAWAMDVALRNASACVVAGDCSGFSFVLSRRMQLAAHGHGVLCVLARPAWEEAELSAAATRWRIRWAAMQEHASQAGAPARSPSGAAQRVVALDVVQAHWQHGPAWHVEMLRCKGVGALLGDLQTYKEARRCVVRSDEATGRITDATLADTRQQQHARQQLGA
jgi:hypothetical protein